MLLNCDLGESFGAWKMGLDDLAMQHIDLANVACGFHAGDADVIADTLLLVKKNKVTLGAHPSYPDKQGFGRRSMSLSPRELQNCLHYQIAALDGMAAIHGISVAYVKPHGALYNDMMANAAIFKTVLSALALYPKRLKLMLLATKQQSQHQNIACEFGIDLLFEAFADRLYQDNGFLTPRSNPKAVHNKSSIMSQVSELLTSKSVTTDTGKSLPIKADTLCVHGDNQDSIDVIKEIKNLINQNSG